MKENIRVQAIKCLENVGIFINNESSEDVCLVDHNLDSITFISFIVELENTFHIEIPSQYISYDFLSSLNSIINVIESLTTPAILNC